MIVRATPRFVVAVAVTFVAITGAVVLGYTELALVGAPWFILLVLGSAHGEPERPQITVEVSDERVVVGDQVDFVATARVAAPSTVTLRPIVHRPHRADDHDSAADLNASVHAIGGGDMQEAIVSVQFDEWGAWRLAGHRVSVSPRFGLFEARGIDDAGASVRVHPDTASLRQLVVPQLTRRSTGRHTARSSGSGLEFADLRPFTTGDDVRSINWRASARSGELQVSQRHPERSADVILLLDSFVESGHDVERILTLTVQAALAVGAGHLGVADRVGVVQFGGLLRWLPPRTGRMHVHRITDFLLGSITFLNQADKQLPVLAPSAWPPRSTVVAISPLLDDRFTEAVIEAKRRGHDVSVLEIDALDPRDLGAQNDVQAVSTRLAVAERRLMRSGLAERGVAVVVWGRDEPVELAMTKLAGLRRQLRVRP